MSYLYVSLAILVVICAGYRLGRSRSLVLAGGEIRALASLPDYYGLYLVLWCAVPSLAVLGLWLILESVIFEWLILAGLPEGYLTTVGKPADLVYSEIRNAASSPMAGVDHDPAIVGALARYDSLQSIAFAAMAVITAVLAAAGAWLGWRRLSPTLAARKVIEGWVYFLMIASSTVAIFTTIGIVLSLLFETIRFFDLVPFHEFLFGIEWSPQTALRADQVGSSGSFGAVPIFAGTLLISCIAMLVAGPIGLFSAIYLSEYANRHIHDLVKPALEILAGIPTVVYGFFAALTVAPLIREAGGHFGFAVASESAIAAGAVMGIMIIPFVSSISDDVITAVPQSLRDGSYALGATKSETICKVVLPAALPGVVGGLLLAVSRAIGETMIVVMAAGLAANLTANPFEAVTTVTVQIVTLLVGDQEFDSAKTLAAFALGLVLFVVTLGLNIIALVTVKKYREAYE